MLWRVRNGVIIIIIIIIITDTGGRKLKKPQLEQIEQFLDGKELHTQG